MNEDLDIEITTLKERKRKLQEIRQLKSEVADLERLALNGTDGRFVIGIVCGEVCAAFNLSLECLMAKGRTNDIAHPRQAAFFLCREIRKLPYAEIARSFHKDTGTVLHGIRATKDRKATDQQYSQFIDQLKERCVAKLKEKNGQISKNSA